MSKLSDYSKFDHLDEGDSSSDEAMVAPPQISAQSAAEAAPQQQRLLQQPLPGPPIPAKIGVTRKTDDGQRYVFECDGRKIYEWDQTLEELNLYVEAPPGVKASHILCDIGHDRLRIKLRGSDRYFIDERTFGLVHTEESSWYLDDGGVMNVVLIKARRGETWEGALRGRDDMGAVDPFTRQQMQKDLMLERFQEENPGFDFRGAQFNGEAPDPRTFMGGVGYS